MQVTDSVLANILRASMTMIGMAGTTDDEAIKKHTLNTGRNLSDTLFDIVGLPTHTEDDNCIRCSKLVEMVNIVGVIANHDPTVPEIDDMLRNFVKNLKVDSARCNL